MGWEMPWKWREKLIRLPGIADLYSVDVAVTGRQTVDAVEKVFALAGDARVGARVEAVGRGDCLDGQPAWRRVHLSARCPVDGRIRRPPRRRPPLFLSTVHAAASVRHTRCPRGRRRPPEIVRKLAVGESRFDKCARWKTRQQTLSSAARRCRVLISAKEVMFSSAFVCLFVSRNTQKLHYRFSAETWHVVSGRNHLVVIRITLRLSLG